MPARTLFVGLDAVDPRLLARWSSEGALPRFAAISGGAATFTLSNAIGTIGGGVWQELNSGRSCGRTGVFFPARQLHTGETAPRPVERHEVDSRGFWTVASAAGKRVAAIDLPQSVVPSDFDGVFVTEWGTHDRLWGEGSVPPELFEELRGQYGDYPVWSRPRPRPTTAACDGHDGSASAYENLFDDLLAGIEKKRELLLDVLGREEWDLFACAFGEGQCSGHQFWHFLEGAASSNGNDRMANAIKSVYERLDSSLGALVDAAGPNVTVFVVASHSFVGRRGGKQLVPEVLSRLGYGIGKRHVRPGAVEGAAEDTQARPVAASPGRDRIATGACRVVAEPIGVSTDTRSSAGRRPLRMDTSEPPRTRAAGLGRARHRGGRDPRGHPCRAPSLAARGDGETDRRKGRERRRSVRRRSSSRRS